MRYIHMLLMALVITSAIGQVGVNNKLPLRPLHIDGKGDNPSIGLPSVVQQKNDVVVDNEGRLGIGTIDPITKVDVKGDVSVGGVMKVHDIEALTSADVVPVFGSLKGDVGTSLVDVNIGLAYLETFDAKNVGSINDFNNGNVLQVSFLEKELLMNVGGLVAVNNGNISMLEDGYYQFSLVLTYFIESSSTFNSFIMVKIQKSSDNGANWVDAIIGRPGFNVTSGTYYYPQVLPSGTAQLKKNDLIRIVYYRSKVGSYFETSDTFKTINIGGSTELGFKGYQLSISKI